MHYWLGDWLISSIRHQGIYSWTSFSFLFNRIPPLVWELNLALKINCTCNCRKDRFMINFCMWVELTHSFVHKKNIFICKSNITTVHYYVKIADCTRYAWEFMTMLGKTHNAYWCIVWLINNTNVMCHKV